MRDLRPDRRAGYEPGGLDPLPWPRAHRRSLRRPDGVAPAVGCRSNPSVLILDEPMAGLDMASRELLISVLDERRRAGLSILSFPMTSKAWIMLCGHPPPRMKRVLAMNDPHSSCGAVGPGGGATHGWFPPIRAQSPGVGGGTSVRRRKPRGEARHVPVHCRGSDRPLGAYSGRPSPAGRLTTCVILQPRWSTLAKSSAVSSPPPPWLFARRAVAAPPLTG